MHTLSPRGSWPHGISGALTFTRYLLAFLAVFLLLYLDHIGLPYD